MRSHFGVCLGVGAIVISIAGCSCSRTQELLDGGLDGAVDAQRMDATRDTADANFPRDDCGVVGEYARCPEFRCRCPVATACSEQIRLCIRRDPSGDSSAISDRTTLKWCGSGWPSIRSSRPDVGTCISEELCLFSRSGADLTPLDCVWSDGTPVVTGHPDEPCPTSIDLRSPFCGGTCGYVECPMIPGGGRDVLEPRGGSESCLGVSDSRGYGVCAWSDSRCHADGLPPEIVAQWFEACSLGFGRGDACACMITEAPVGGRESGSFVLASSCVAYARAHPGVICRDASWAVMP